LNFIIIPAIAWAALMTGDTQHVAKGDAAFLSTCALGSWQYDKQLNELLGGYTTPPGAPSSPLDAVKRPARWL
jgi:hypothetical protein